MLTVLCFSVLIAFSSTQEIDQQITDLKAKLQQDELKEINKEAKSQSDFIANWPAYAQDVEENKKNEELVQHLKKEIDELEQRKLELLRKKSSTQ